MIDRAPRQLKTFLLAAFGAALVAATALGAEDFGRAIQTAQLFDRRPADMEDDAPTGSRDASASSVRLDRLENQLRSLNGLVEQLQHDIRRLEEQSRRAQDGASAGLAPQRSAAQPADLSAPPVPAPPTVPGPAGFRRGDAFDPSREPNAPGAPRPLGTTPPTPPLPGPPTSPTVSDLRSPGAPLDLTRGRLSTDAGAGAAPLPPPPTTQGVAAAPPPALQPQSPRDEFDLALAQFRLGQYEAAEKGFSGFLAKNAKNKLAPQAVFYLGESFFSRERHREAAEKYLEISTKYPTSPQAPEAMLRLGQSLHAIGAKEQACASFSEIAVKYPGAPARVKEAAQRESKKDQC